MKITENKSRPFEVTKSQGQSETYSRMVDEVDEKLRRKMRSLYSLELNLELKPSKIRNSVGFTGDRP